MIHGFERTKVRVGSKSCAYGRAKPPQAHPGAFLFSSNTLLCHQWSRSIRRSVPSSVCQSLVGAFVYYRGWIMVTRHRLASWPACLTVSCLSSKRQLGRSPVFVARGILQMFSPVFTGCEHSSASSSNWRSLSTKLFAALHLSTCWTGCSTSLIYWRDETPKPAALVDLQSSRCSPVAACHCLRSLFCCC